MDRFLIAGLGNPGAQYEKTRHNAGFMVADAFARSYSASFQPWQKLGEYAKLSVSGKEVFIVKPMTYMNLSGQMVSSLARFYKIPSSNILVCFPACPISDNVNNKSPLLFSRLTPIVV